MYIIKKLIKILKKKIKYFFRPAILRNIEVSSQRSPRLSKEMLKDSWVESFKGEDLDGIFSQISRESSKLLKSFEPGDRVLIKINLNTADDYPASTDPDTLNHLIRLLREKGIREIIVGDCSANVALPTSRVIKRKNLHNTIDKGVQLISFDDSNWVRVAIDGNFLKEVIIPEEVYMVDKIIYLANLKTHYLADFSMSMKLAVGFMHPLQRIEMHQAQLKEKIVELTRAVQPDLIFLDAREPFITLGPDKGKKAKGKMILVGNQLLDVDLKGYELLYCLKKGNNCLEDFKEDAFEMKQFAYAKYIQGD